MKERAYAKINLALDVTGVRADGYHELDSIMLPIDFYDLLEISIADEDSYSCNWRYLKYNSSNSIRKMIELLKDRFGISDRHQIRLTKCVPLQAGLGGGTADAAAALRLFEKMYGLDLSREQIRDICTAVGADVLFNYYNVPARVRGIGDIIEPISIVKDYYILLVKPRSGVSTRMAFEKLDIEDCDHPDIDRLLDVLTKGEDFEGLLENSLQKAAQELNDEIREVIRRLEASKAPNVLMSGSGSTVFCISEDRTEIIRQYNSFKDDRCYIRFGKILKK